MTDINKPKLRDQLPLKDFKKSSRAPRAPNWDHVANYILNNNPNILKSRGKGTFKNDPKKGFRSLRKKMTNNLSENAIKKIIQNVIKAMRSRGVEMLSGGPGVEAVAQEVKDQANQQIINMMEPQGEEAKGTPPVEDLAEAMAQIDKAVAKTQADKPPELKKSIKSSSRNIQRQPLKKSTRESKKDLLTQPQAKKPQKTTFAERDRNRIIPMTSTALSKVLKAQGMTTIERKHIPRAVAIIQTIAQGGSVPILSASLRDVAINIMPFVSAAAGSLLPDGMTPEIILNIIERGGGPPGGGGPGGGGGDGGDPDDPNDPWYTRLKNWAKRLPRAQKLAYIGILTSIVSTAYWAFNKYWSGEKSYNEAFREFTDNSTKIVINAVAPGAGLALQNAISQGADVADEVIPAISQAAGNVSDLLVDAGGQELIRALENTEAIKELLPPEIAMFIPQNISNVVNIKKHISKLRGNIQNMTRGKIKKFQNKVQSFVDNTRNADIVLKIREIVFTPPQAQALQIQQQEEIAQIEQGGFRQAPLRDQQVFFTQAPVSQAFSNQPLQIAPPPPGRAGNTLVPPMGTQMTPKETPINTQSPQILDIIAQNFTEVPNIRRALETKNPTQTLKKLKSRVPEWRQLPLKVRESLLGVAMIEGPRWVELNEPWIVKSLEVPSDHRIYNYLNQTIAQPQSQDPASVVSPDQLSPDQLRPPRPQSQPERLIDPESPGIDPLDGLEPDAGGGSGNIPPGPTLEEQIRILSDQIRALGGEGFSPGAPKSQILVDNERITKLDLRPTLDRGNRPNNVYMTPRRSEEFYDHSDRAFRQTENNPYGQKNGNIMHDRQVDNSQGRFYKARKQTPQVDDVVQEPNNYNTQMDSNKNKKRVRGQSRRAFMSPGAAERRYRQERVIDKKEVKLMSNIGMNFDPYNLLQPSHEVGRPYIDQRPVNPNERLFSRRFGMRA